MDLANHPFIKSKGIKINLYEKGNTIIPGWKSISLGGKKFNNGFHGIEMPRAEKAFNMLSQSIGLNNFKKIPNYKLCMIDDLMLPFGKKLNEWPEQYRLELERLNDEINLNKEIKSKYCLSQIGNYKLGKLIHSCFPRYSNKIELCWNNFFPWFFPSEFFSEESDEGWKFRSASENNSQKQFYSVPNDYKFESLISPIEKSLLKTGVNLIKNTQIDKSMILSMNDRKDILPIWTASSAILLSLLNQDVASNIFNEKRFMHLFLFQSQGDTLLKSFNTYKEMPSEVICINNKSTGLSRLSFPFDRSSSKANKNLLLIEFYGQNQTINGDTIQSIQDSLEQSIGINLKYLDHKLARKVFFVSTPILDKSKLHLMDELKNLSLQVPFTYWWPINIAKCGSAVKKVTDKIISKVSN